MSNSSTEKMYSVWKKIKYPEKTICDICEYNNYQFAPFIPDKVYLKCLYKMHMRKKLDLSHPTAFTEKIQWLKLYDRKPEYTKMVDKFEVKKFVANTIGEKYVIPTLGLWDSFDEINFEKLPNQFVLKVTHDSGGLVICTDKEQLDIDKAREKINSSLSRRFYYYGREWPYKNVKPRIIAEAYMADSHGELNDYKFFCFNGKPKALFVATDRFADTKFDFFDLDFNHLSIVNGHPNADTFFVRPENFEMMIKLAARLSEGIPHVRVDLYNVDSRVYFGELTFSHYSGIVPFEPEEWDKIFGDWLELPAKH